MELDDLGLQDATESHIDRFPIRSGIDVAFHSSSARVELSPVVSENVYRLIQESLNSVLKHSAATEVNVQLKVDDERHRNSAVGSMNP